jgi:Sjoegren syndrome nuclear autoantigen 1
MSSSAGSKGALQNYNNELVRCIDDLREKREEVNRNILRDEEEKAKIQKELTRLTERLSKINEELARRMQARNEFDQTIQETEAAYMKILESSQTLLTVLKREATTLQKKKASRERCSQGEEDRRTDGRAGRARELCARGRMRRAGAARPRGQRLQARGRELREGRASRSMQSTGQPARGSRGSIPRRARLVQPARAATCREKRRARKLLPSLTAAGADARSPAFSLARSPSPLPRAGCFKLRCGRSSVKRNMQCERRRPPS